MFYSIPLKLRIFKNIAGMNIIKFTPIHNYVGSHDEITISERDGNTFLGFSAQV